MPREEKINQKALKTGVLVGGVNLMLLPLYLYDSQLSFIVSCVTTVGMLYTFHEIGESRRPGSNALSGIGSFFCSNIGAHAQAKNMKADNAFRNIINGGAATYDQFFPGQP